MDINNDDKIPILLNLLSERYNSAHNIRERSLKLTIWALGLAVAFIWILVKGTTLLLSQKIILTFFIIVLCVNILWFLYSLQKGAEKNRKVMIDIEEALGCYDEGVYLSERALFPKQYKDKNKKSWCTHFKTLYLLIFPITFIIMFLIWVTPSKNEHAKKMKINIENRCLDNSKKIEEKHDTHIMAKRDKCK